MFHSRRYLLRSTLSFAALSALASRFAAAQGHTPQPLPSPHAPNPNFPNGMDGPPPSTDSKNQKPVDKRRQEEIRVNVEKLYSLVSEMRQYLGAAGNADVLSISFVKQASDAEKLAKRIRDLARG